MKKSNRVSHVKEIELCKEAQSGSKNAMEHMVKSNLGLVNKIVKKFYHKNDQYSYEDLFQEGVIGLMKAINKFDSTQGCRFSTYSYYWIYCFVSRYHVNHHGKIRVPSHITEKLRKYQKEGDVRLDELKESVPVVVSLNKLIGESSTLEDIIPYENEPSYNEELDMMKDEMKKVLTEKEYDILCHRYGMDGQETKTQRSCAKIYDVSYTTIYMIEKKAINKLKLHFNQ